MYRRLTEQEVRSGLYADPSRIGTEAGWRQVLEGAGKTHRGHRLVGSRAEA